MLSGLFLNFALNESMYMRNLLFLLFIISQPVFGQKNFPEQKVLKNLQKHVSYLADDKLEGRRTGSAGEKLAADYIIKQFKQAGIGAYTGKTYLQPFVVNDGRSILEGSTLLINGDTIQQTDFFPLGFSGSGYADAALGTDKLFVFDLARTLTENHTNPHFDLEPVILNAVADAEKRKVYAMIIVNTSGFPDQLKFDARNKTPQAALPVVYVKKNAIEKYLEEGNEKEVPVKLKIGVENKSRTGHNVAAYIDNGAANTIVLGAHYDHLGYGEDHNSLYAGKDPQIHNGADDNASGTAALIELGKLLKKSGSKNNNYLLVAFSGEELGLYGSKYFVEHFTDPARINYMINMDMLGRLNDSTRGLTVGGFGTSPTWSSVITNTHPYLKIKVDSSGSGPSDHTSFYRKDIPVLFFFTGTHSDYHKPSDDADRINYKGQLEVVKYIYNVVAQTKDAGKLAFLKTREPNMGKSSFKVSLGIMPDYTFSGNGVLVDGISEGRAAEKAGMKAGDVIIQLGEHKVTDVMTYMDALNKFNKGESTRAKIVRGKEEMLLPVTF